MLTEKTIEGDPLVEVCLAKRPATEVEEFVAQLAAEVTTLPDETLAASPGTPEGDESLSILSYMIERTADAKRFTNAAPRLISFVKTPEGRAFFDDRIRHEREVWNRAEELCGELRLGRRR